MIKEVCYYVILMKHVFYYVTVIKQNKDEDMAA
jgi:hypothetical protein